jgi:hypothetical protein
VLALLLALPYFLHAFVLPVTWVELTLLIKDRVLHLAACWALELRRLGAVVPRMLS